MRGITEAAAMFNKSPEQLQAILSALKRNLNDDELKLVKHVEHALLKSGEVSAHDLDAMQGIIRRFGGEGSAALRMDMSLSPASAVDETLLFRTDVDVWRRGLNEETRRLLQANPSIARRFESMSPNVRRVLTRCGSPCIPTSATDDHVRRIEAVLARHNPDADDLQLLRTYFFLRRSNLNDAISSLEGLRRRGTLSRFLRSKVDVADAVLLPRPAWRKNEALRGTVTELVNSGDISVERFAAIMRSSAKAGTSGPRIVGYVENLLTLRRRGIGGVDAVLGEMAAGPGFFTGAEWVLRYVDRRGLWNAVERFEASAEALEFAAGHRRWDAIINGQLVQFKSWSGLYPDVFVRQVFQDFRNTSGFSSRGVRWIFEPRIGSAENVRVAAEQALRDMASDPNRLRKLVTGLEASDDEIMKMTKKTIDYLNELIIIPSRADVSL